MAIPGEFLWLNAQGENDKFSPNNVTLKAANVTDMDLFLARRWKHFFGGSEKLAYQTFAASTLTAAQKSALMKPGTYPVVTMTNGTATVALMPDGKFPNVVNYQGDKKSPAGVLGLPERNKFGGESVSITDPAI